MTITTLVDSLNNLTSALDEITIPINTQLPQVEQSLSDLSQSITIGINYVQWISSNVSVIIFTIVGVVVLSGVLVKLCNNHIFTVDKNNSIFYLCYQKYYKVEETCDIV